MPYTNKWTSKYYINNTDKIKQTHYLFYQTEMLEMLFGFYLVQLKKQSNLNIEQLLDGHNFPKCFVLTEQKQFVKVELVMAHSKNTQFIFC